MVGGTAGCDSKNFQFMGRKIKNLFGKKYFGAKEREMVIANKVDLAKYILS